MAQQSKKNKKNLPTKETIISEYETKLAVDAYFEELMKELVTPSQPIKDTKPTKKK